jgi:hypothetical protein
MDEITPLKSSQIIMETWLNILERAIKNGDSTEIAKQGIMKIARDADMWYHIGVFPNTDYREIMKVYGFGAANLEESQKQLREEFTKSSVKFKKGDSVVTPKGYIGIVIEHRNNNDVEIQIDYHNRSETEVVQSICLKPYITL